LRRDEEDRIRWDDRYARPGPAPIAAAPALLAPFEHLFPTSGHAMDVACGRASLPCGWPAGGWKSGDSTFPPWPSARRGIWHAAVASATVADSTSSISTTASRTDRPSISSSATGSGSSPRRAIIQRLAPGGLLAITALSEVDAEPGPFRASPGELPAAFAELDVIAAGEGHGEAWLLGRA